MALTNALSMTVLGLMTTDTKISLTSQNITNADKVGYTRKSLDTRYLTTNNGSAPVGGVVSGSTDKFLTQAIVGDTADATYNQVIADSLDYYSSQLGATDGSTTMSGFLNDMYSALQYLATNPETNANRSEVVSVASKLADSLRSLSGTIQDQRTQAEQKISETVTTINAALDKIKGLNDQISKLQASTSSDSSLAEYEDERMQALQDLGAETDIQFYFTSNNTVQIYTQSGMPLLTSVTHPITYNATSFVNGSVTYPGSIGPITLDGADITTGLRSGRLAALVSLRDKTYVQEQQKLDEVASVLKTQTNTILNTGASVPPRNPMDSTLSGLTAGTALTATGIVRVAVTDASGLVQSYSDINLATTPTIGALITALNGIPGITASLNANGELSMAAAPATSGVSINEMTSNVTPANVGFQNYFGFNDMFTGNGAETININSYLTSGIDYLPVGILSSSATLAVGDRGVARGDGSVAQALSSQLTSTNVNFAAAGNFGAQTNTLKRYVEAVMSDVATNAKISQNAADTSALTYKQTKSTLDSKAGVNVDEETAKMTVLENQYQSSAKVIQVIQAMMKALLDAVG